ncbi:ribonuclease Y [Clostridium sp. CAG:1000]|jgi:ribonuclease Y|nr:ribonuclease Y [Clostridium sp. CAG:1000]
MNNTIFSILLVVVGLFVGAFIMLIINKLKVSAAQKEADKLIQDAKREAERAKRDGILELKEESYKLKNQTDAEVKEKKKELNELNQRIDNREKSLDKRDELLTEREKNLDLKDKDLLAKQKEIQEKDAKMENIIKEQIALLEKISGFSKEKARDMVLKKVEEEMSREVAVYLKDREDEAKLEADRKAKELLVSSMQRYSNDVTSEQTVSTVELPNDEMKGRIIGREGRNIRTIEAVTGVDLIIDDTPEVIVLSSFDPLRREMAKVTLETLIKDGRIHPARIEELYDKVCEDYKKIIREKGEEALFELGLSKVDPEVVELIGKLAFRTSYGQDALAHSKEVAHLTGLMAAELGENVSLAKRAGLLHDIGKSIDFEVEGSHVEIGADIAKKHGEDKVVINAIESHHGDKKAEYVISELVAIADTLSAARPGARNDSLENYVKRLEELEHLGNEIEGVEKTFAMQAGRELRVVVKPDKVDDLTSYKIAREIKTKIEDTMQYPGTIKVVVIRETRAEEVAK